MWSVFALCLVHVLDFRDELQRVDNIIAMCVMCVIGLLCIPIVGLTGFHIVLVARGRTTNEQVTGKMREGHNPFSFGCCTNFRHALCGPMWPRLVGRGQKSYVINVDSAKIAYRANDSNVKIYLETDNGVTKNSREFDHLLNNSIEDEAMFRNGTPLPDPDLQPPRSDSYSNLFDDGQDVPLGGSAHSLRSLLAKNPGWESPNSACGDQSTCGRPLAPDALYSPVGHVPSNAVVMPRLSDVPSEYDDPRYLLRTVAVVGGGTGGGGTDDPDGDVILRSDAKYPTVQALAPDATYGGDNAPRGGTFRSMGGRSSPLSSSKPKENTLRAVSPINVDCRTATMTGGLLVPPSGATVISHTEAMASRRPMSFVKALELSDKLAATDTNLQQWRRGGGVGGGSVATGNGIVHQATVAEEDEEDEPRVGGGRSGNNPDRTKFGGSSYEIAV
jgi:hypothetical protein